MLLAGAPTACWSVSLAPDRLSLFPGTPVALRQIHERDPAWGCLHGAPGSPRTDRSARSHPRAFPTLPYGLKDTVLFHLTDEDTEAQRGKGLLGALGGQSRDWSGSIPVLAPSQEAQCPFGD